MGSLWGHFGVTLGSLWGQCGVGVTLGLLWGQSGDGRPPHHRPLRGLHQGADRCDDCQWQDPEADLAP
eukprot:11201580-Heterocapsa_arctica.AAC.1